MRKEDQLNTKYFKKFWDILEYQFIISIDNKGKINLNQVYFEANENTITYKKTKQVINKAYQWFGGPSSLNPLYN